VKRINKGERMKHNRMIYALKEEKVTHISDVERGLKCGCICPACGAALIANKGTKVIHHFKHYNAEECQIGYQTSLHLLAKEIISNAKKFTIPEVLLKFESCKEPIQISPAKNISVDSVELEKKVGDIIPDIILHSKNKILLIEIFVTHKIDEEKMIKLQKQGISVIEIDLSKIDRTINKNDLQQYLLYDCPEKKWKYNRVLKYWRNCFISIAEKYTSRSSTRFGLGHPYVYCPLGGKPLIEDCHYYCEYCLSSYANTKEECFVNGEPIYPDPKILCTGKQRISTLDDLKAYLRKNKLNKLF
jgi:hypothetical protein